MIRFLTAGESHGQCLIGILEGMPAGLVITEAEIAADLHRRQQGHGRGDRMKIEKDHAKILSGVRFGETTGAPIALRIENKDWVNWGKKMSVSPLPREEQTEPLTSPRPGHADYSGAMKYGHADIRNVIERSSARETTMRVALAAICRKFFSESGVSVGSHVIRIGGVDANTDISAFTAEDIRERADMSPVRCLDGRAETQMIARIDEAISKKDTVGGKFEVVVDGLPVGTGSYVHYDRRLDAILAQAMMSIHAMKAVGFGLGEEVSNLLGSEVHDRLYSGSSGISRKTNHAGGIEGGMSNGERLQIRVSMKPLSTLMQPLDSVNLATGEAIAALRERSDVCAVPAASVIGEAMALLSLMNPFLEKFGGDSMKEISAHVKATPPPPWG